MNEVVAIRVDSPDPAAGTRVLTQLRSRPEVVIAGPQGRPAVALAVLADASDDALSWLRSLRARTGLPIVVVIGPAEPDALVRLVESGACGVLGRAEATAERLVRAVRLAAAGRGDLPPALVRHLLNLVGQRNRDPATLRGLPGGGS
jgi:DNA-binding NarL/FixJ family response regulator